MLEYLETVSISGITGWIPGVIGITLELVVVGIEGPMLSIKMVGVCFDVSFEGVAKKEL